MFKTLLSKTAARVSRQSPHLMCAVASRVQTASLVRVSYLCKENLDGKPIHQGGMISTSVQPGLDKESKIQHVLVRFDDGSGKDLGVLWRFSIAEGTDVIESLSAFHDVDEHDQGQQNFREYEMAFRAKVLHLQRMQDMEKIEASLLPERAFGAKR